MLRTRVGNVARRLRVYRGQRLRAMSRELFFRCAKRFTPTLVAESCGMRFTVPTYDRALGLMTFANGPPEQDTMKLAVSILKARGDWSRADSMTLLEIGANIGTATAVALGEGFKEAICFEPLPGNQRLLRDNLAANGFLDRVQTMDIALSDRDGEADFEISPNNSGDGRVRVSQKTGDTDAFDENARQVVKVKLAQLDSLCEEGLLDLSRVCLAWIDAQGHEGHILSGAQRLLQSPVPVVTEFWPYGLNRSGGKQAFIGAVRTNYNWIVDLGSQTTGSPLVEMPAGEIEALFRDYERGSFFDPAGSTASTDLLLLKTVQWAETEQPVTGL